VQTETKKAFKKLSHLEAAAACLCTLKGVGTTLASAVLAAGAPHIAPFMADECLLSLPEIEGLDYTLKEYLRLVEKTKECVARLNSQGGEWNPHTVELAIWTHYVARDLKPELLEDMPGSKALAKTSTLVKSSPTKATATEDTSSAVESTTATPTAADTAAAETNGVNGVHKEEKVVGEKEEGAGESTTSTITQEESGSKEDCAVTSNNINTDTTTAESSNNTDTTTANNSKTSTTESNGVSPAENKSSTEATPEQPEDSTASTPAPEVSEVAKESAAEESTTEMTETAGTEKMEVSSSRSNDSSVKVNGDATNEHAEKNGVVSEPAETEAPAAAETEKQQNGNSSSITKEETFNGDSAKRPLEETEDSDLSDAKRLKEDAAAIPHPIQAN
jgi:hypothetical protein